jgi:hypothetical protein
MLAVSSTATGRGNIAAAHLLEAHKIAQPRRPQSFPELCMYVHGRPTS